VLLSETCGVWHMARNVEQLASHCYLQLDEIRHPPIECGKMNRGGVSLLCHRTFLIVDTTPEAICAPQQGHWRSFRFHRNTGIFTDSVIGLTHTTTAGG